MNFGSSMFKGKLDQKIPKTEVSGNVYQGLVVISIFFVTLALYEL